VARFKSSDGLGDVKGGLLRAFRTSTLTVLQNAFLAATSAAEKPKALEALDQFHRAARRLRLSQAAPRQRISKNTFNEKARDARSASPRSVLLAHLPTSEQFAAMRGFSAAKETLLSISPDVGRSIVRLVALGAEITTPQPRSQPTRRLNLQA
jgi:hypothetical protein